MRVTLAAVATLAALIVVAPAGAATKGPLTIDTHLNPRYVFFGDTVTARLDVLFDPRVVEAPSVEVNPSFGIWQELSAPQVTSTSSGQVMQETWQFRLSCWTYACVPKQPSVQTFKLPAFVVTARTVKGRTVNAKTSWPTAQVTARYYPPEVGNVRPALRPETHIPPAAYAIRPGLLAWLLDAAGVLALLATTGFVAIAVYRRRLRHRRSVEARSSLERALALVREAQQREPDDRRRAVGLLARTLESGPERDVRSATRIAWSEEEPSAERLEDLAEQVAADLERRPG